MKTGKQLLLVGIFTMLMLTSVMAYDDQTEFIKYFDSHPEIQEFVDSVEVRITGDVSSLSESELIELEKQFLVDNPEYLQDELNNLMGNVPNSVKWVIEDTRINVIMEDGYELGILYGKNKIEDIKDERLQDPDMHLYISDDFFSALNDGNVELSELTRDKAIGFKGVGFLNKMKFGAAKIAFRSFSFW
jgi:hypothetical protein